MSLPRSLATDSQQRLVDYQANLNRRLHATESNAGRSVQSAFAETSGETIIDDVTYSAGLLVNLVVPNNRQLVGIAWQAEAKKNVGGPLTNLLAAVTFSDLHGPLGNTVDFGATSNSIQETYTYVNGGSVVGGENVGRLYTVVAEPGAQTVVVQWKLEVGEGYIRDRRFWAFVL